MELKSVEILRFSFKNGKIKRFIVCHNVSETLKKTQAFSQDKIWYILRVVSVSFSMHDIATCHTDRDFCMETVD